MKKNKNLLIAGAALIVWFLLKNKKTTTTENELNITTPNNTQTRIKKVEFKKMPIRTARKNPADVSGIIY